MAARLTHNFWTTDEIDFLKRHMGASEVEVAQILGRSVRAVNNKKVQLRRSSGFEMDWRKGIELQRIWRNVVAANDSIIKEAA